MKELKLNLKCCYGIKSLEAEFDFSSDRAYAIYAPNGAMKTSFAKTFKDLSQNVISKDLVFPDRQTTRDIKDDLNKDITPESIFVIEPYNEQYESDKLSTLLVRKELKDEYNNIYKELEQEKIEFIKKLKSTSLSTDCESEFKSTFSHDESNDFFELLNEVSSRLDGNQKKYDFRYNDIFDKKGNVKKFLDKHKESIELYIKNYESLISSSQFFKKSNNTFGTYQANELLQSTSDNSFFEAGHSLALNDDTKITSVLSFKSLIEQEINKIVNDTKLKTIFDKVDKAIGANVELRSFKNAIEKNNLILAELNNYEDFKKKVWIGYLDQLKSDVTNLVNLYSFRKIELVNIITKAKADITDWETSIEEFNERFRGLPFKLTVVNKEDVILKTGAPALGYDFCEQTEEKRIAKKELIDVLSQGERRALYLLNIIFEVQARKKLGQKTLFIIDDIADSFDYKNKYAIIEYLKDISEEQNFYQIILTHNFDFFRTIFLRILKEDRSKAKMVVKTETEIEIVNASSLKPFDYFKKNLHLNSRILIASIPFVRNLAEYSGHHNEKTKLTSLLHIKNDTSFTLIGDLENIFKTILVDKNTLNLNDKGKKVLDLIFEQSEEILNETLDYMNLESKIVLSIAIRLKAEQFLITSINDQKFVDQITKNQTIQLIEKYKELFPSKKENIIALEQVNLMTPENIHLNSFMYEPIIDMSDSHLKKLYQKIKSLN